MSTIYTKSKKSSLDLGIIPELLKLMKPRVMSLVIFTCAVGLLTAPNVVSTKDAVIGILLVSLGAGAAGAQLLSSLKFENNGNVKESKLYNEKNK